MPSLSSLSLEQFDLKILEIGDTFSFDCGDDDLTEFFHKDAIPHKKELVGVTYCYYSKKDNEAIGFFTVSNNAIRTKGFKEQLDSRKQYPFYPAVKIGRLGVNKIYQGCGLGSQIMTMVKFAFTYSNKTGCRFITVDAYNSPPQLLFYEKNGFIFLTEKDKGYKTRELYFDLKPFRDSLDIEMDNLGEPISFSSR